MEISSTYRFAAAPLQVWNLLMDPEAIKSCLPGCRELRPLADDRYQADIVIGVGAVSGAFASTITISDRVPPQSYRLGVEAIGKPGFARGSAAIVLTPTPSGTDVQVTATADVGGLIARVGQRLIEGGARMTMDRLFNCLSARVQP